MTLAAGATLGPYEILSAIGAGGMGEVYRARDPRLNRSVAIKLLSVPVADDEARRRFEREARTASSLNHPHLLTVFETGEWLGRPYLVTEFIDGGTLREWSRGATRSWRQMVDLLIGVADGLACAHDAGVLHRDVKPDNILVTKNGYAKLADFGLAKLTAGTTGDLTRSLTEPGTRRDVILGTIAYMSPEQALGRPVDARSDIFSFGVVLYELIAARRPFSGPTELQVLQTIMHGAPDPLPADVPLPLRMIIEKALDHDPADRYQTMRDLVVDLRRLSRLKSAAAGAPAVPRAAARWMPWAVVVALAGGVGWFESRRPTNPPENPLTNARFTRFTDFDGTERDAAISPDGRFVAFLSDRDGPFDIWFSQVGTGRFANLTQGKEDVRTNLRSLGFSGDGSEIWLRGQGTSRRPRLMPVLGGPARPFLGDRAFNMAWSPDGSRIAYHTNEDGDPLFVADHTGANARQIFVNRNPGGHNHYPAWSQDGHWIYFASGNGHTFQMDLWRIASGGGTPERLTHHNDDVEYPTPIDTHTVLYVAPDEAGSGPWLWAFDVARRLTRRVSFGVERYTSVAASTDGRRVVTAVANPRASLWTVPILDHVAEERDVQPLPLPTVRALAPRYSGTSLFYLSSHDAGDGLWRYRDGQALEIWRGADGALFAAPAIAADGSRVAVVVRQSGKLHLHISNADGSEARAFADSIDVRGAPCWSPDGKWIVTGGDDAAGSGLFKIPVEGGAPIRIAAGPVLDPQWSPDGGLIVYVGVGAGNFAPLLAMRPDGTPVDLPAIRVRAGGERTRFLASGKALIYMQGLEAQDFWMLDLASRKTRQLTHLNNSATMTTFDIAPGGRQIVFDRLWQNSDIVLIDLPR